MSSKKAYKERERDDVFDGYGEYDEGNKDSGESVEDHTSIFNGMVDAMTAILYDHDERMRLYPDIEGQPNRLHVMGTARNILSKIENS